MVTKVAIDPDLMAKALALSGEKTKKAAVNNALREFIARREQMKLLELFGQLEWSDDEMLRSAGTPANQSPVGERRFEPSPSSNRDCPSRAEPKPDRTSG